MKETKKILCTLLVILMVFMSAPIGLELGVTASAEEEIKTSGKCGDNAYWTFEPDTGKLVISGTGDMWDESLGFATYYGSPYFDTPLKSVVIEDGITSIGKGNFYYCVYLRDVTIPDSVTKIGKGAFGGCGYLETINIPDKVTFIDKEAFELCASLKSVSIPACVEHIGLGAFSLCLSLSCITVDENNKYFSNDSDGVLFDKNKSTLVQYPIGKKATSYTLPESVKTVDERSFMYAVFLENILLPEGLTTIKDFAFYDCYSLASINLPESLDNIGSGVFSFCFGMSEITFPKSIKALGDGAFIDCPYTDKIYIKSMDTTIGEYFGVSSYYVEGIEKEEFIDLIVNDNEETADYLHSYEDDSVFSATIYCHAGSTAEEYAKANGANYVLTHFYEGEWTYDKANSIRYRKCINCDEIEIEHIEDEPQDNNSSFFAKLLAFLKSIFEKIKSWFK